MTSYLYRDPLSLPSFFHTGTCSDAQITQFVKGLLGSWCCLQELWAPFFCWYPRSSLSSPLTARFAESFFSRESLWQFRREEGCSLVLCGSNIIQGNWIFQSLWLLVLTPVAEIGRLCIPLPGRSDFCRDYWLAWLFMRDGGCAWTWSLVTAWHPVLCPLRVEAWRLRALVCTEQWFRTCRWCRGHRLPSPLTRTVKGLCLCKTRVFLSLGRDSPALAFPPPFFLQSLPLFKRSGPNNACFSTSIYWWARQGAKHCDRTGAPCMCVTCFREAQGGVPRVHRGGPWSPDFGRLESFPGQVML